MKSITWPQALVTLAGLAAIAGAHLTGPYAGTLVSASVAILFYLRQPPPPPPPAVKAVLVALIGGAFAAHLAACAGTFTPAQDVELGQHGAALADCEALMRLAPEGGQIRELHRCEIEAGLLLPDGGVP